MSSRNDTLLNLCLSQTELSPLHYRHGSVIIRGGKVIGQGFDCYCPGFDGGALKSGVLPSSGFDGPIVELKSRLKSTSKSKHNINTNVYLDRQQDASPFMPFEIAGTGHNSNKSLSVHSEMMAIVSALSLSSATQASQISARATASLQKPCFSLPAGSQKRKLRAKALKATQSQSVRRQQRHELSGLMPPKTLFDSRALKQGASQPDGAVRDGGDGQQVSQGQEHGQVVLCAQQWRETTEGQEGREREVWSEISSTSSATSGST